MRVLVACECSQNVCKAFRDRSIEAFSCDIQDCYGGYPQWHIKCNVEDVLFDKWDLVIAHPPCTYLSRVQANRIFKRLPDGSSVVRDYSRLYKGLKASLFFRRFFDAPAPFLCVENPLMLSCWGIRRPDCIIQPYEFGHPFSKSTCLWLRNLPPLMPTDLYSRSCVRGWVNSVPGFSSNTKFKQSRLRSETFPGIARAIAVQYGDYVLSNLHKFRSEV